MSLLFHVSFSNIVSSLNILRYENLSENLENINDPLEIIREKYKSHSSVLAIPQQQFGNSYRFIIIPKEEIEEEISGQNDAKVSH